jgi:transposase
LEFIGEFYKLEREYEEGKLSPEQVRLCRNNLKTKEIIIKLRSKLDALLSDDHPLHVELMEKVISYMNTFWTQLFAYLSSDKMARVLAIYHTIVSACKMQGVSVLDYFKRFFSEIVKGRRDYEHLLPLTIGLD